MDSAVAMTGSGLDSEIPTTETETGRDAGGVAVKVQGCGCAVVTLAGLDLDKLVERKSMMSAVGDTNSATFNCWIASACN